MSYLNFKSGNWHIWNSVKYLVYFGIFVMTEFQNVLCFWLAISQKLLNQFESPFLALKVKVSHGPHGEFHQTWVRCHFMSPRPAHLFGGILYVQPPVSYKNKLPNFVLSTVSLLHSALRYFKCNHQCHYFAYRAYIHLSILCPILRQ